MGDHEEMRLVTEFSQTGRGPAHRNGHGVPPTSYLLPPVVSVTSIHHQPPARGYLLPT